MENSKPDLPWELPIESEKFAFTYELWIAALLKISALYRFWLSFTRNQFIQIIHKSQITRGQASLPIPPPHKKGPTAKLRGHPRISWRWKEPTFTRFNNFNVQPEFVQMILSTDASRPTACLTIPWMNYDPFTDKHDHFMIDFLISMERINQPGTNKYRYHFQLNVSIIVYLQSALTVKGPYETTNLHHCRNLHIAVGIIPGSRI